MVPIVIGSVSAGGKTCMKVLAVYLGKRICRSFQIPPPAPKPRAVKKIISNIWRRKIPKTSFAVIEAATGGLDPAGRDILLEAIGFSSAIIISV